MSATDPLENFQRIIHAMSAADESKNGVARIPCKSCPHYFSVAQCVTVAHLMSLAMEHYEICPVTGHALLDDVESNSETANHLEKRSSNENNPQIEPNGRETSTTISRQESPAEQIIHQQQDPTLSRGVAGESKKRKRMTKSVDGTSEASKIEEIEEMDDFQKLKRRKITSAPTPKPTMKQKRRKPVKNPKTGGHSCCYSRTAVDESIGKPHRSETERCMILYYDPFVTRFKRNTVTCNPCNTTICMDRRSHFYPGLYEKHKRTCPVIKQILDRHWDAELDAVIIPADTRNFDADRYVERWKDEEDEDEVEENRWVYPSFRSLYGIENLNAMINEGKKKEIAQVEKSMLQNLDSAAVEEESIAESLSTQLSDPAPSLDRLPETFTNSHQAKYPFTAMDDSSMKYIDRRIHEGTNGALKDACTVRRMFTEDKIHYFEPKYRCSTYQELQEYKGTEWTDPGGSSSSRHSTIG